MGGDHAPHAPVAGALLALAELGSEHSVTLVGRTQVIEEELNRLEAQRFHGFDASRARISLVEAPDVIEMTDRPTAAIRGKPHLSLIHISEPTRRTPISYAVFC